jgi:hypothetical protein
MEAKKALFVFFGHVNSLIPIDDAPARCHAREFGPPPAEGTVEIQTN